MQLRSYYFLSVVALLILISLVHVWALLSRAYFYIWWLDIVMHLVGGFWIGLFSIYLVPEKFLGPFSFLFILGVVALAGIFWEFLEFALNQIWESIGRFAFFQPSIEDTLADLLADLIGGGLAAFVLRKVLRKIR